MFALSTTTIKNNHTATTLKVDVDDPVLQKGLAKYPTLAEKQNYIEDMAEIGSRVTAHQSHDTQTADLIKILQRQLQESRTSHQENLRLVEAKRAEEKALYLEQLTHLNQSVERMEERLQIGEKRGQDTIQDLEKEASRLLNSVGDQVLVTLRDQSQDTAGIRETIRETLERATDDVTEHIQNASVLLQSYHDREEARNLAQEMKEKTSHHKGANFENRLFSELSEFADHRGDQVQYTGTIADDGTFSKKGDILYTLGGKANPVRIAIEAKDRRLTRSGKNPYFLPDLRASKVERQAKYGLVVASLDENSKPDGRPNFMPLKSLGDNNFAVLVDEEQPVPIALLSAIQMISTLEKHHGDHDLVTEKNNELKRRLQKIGELSGDLKTLRKSAKHMHTNLLNIEDTLQSFERELKRQVRGLESLVKAED